ncbi:MAG: hypothetical protein HQL40_19310 [Alphaproteobacteria bacterium]|nr:hypothetical protein [Alphaproteobacteria bacterium]
MDDHQRPTLDDLKRLELRLVGDTVEEERRRRQRVDPAVVAAALRALDEVEETHITIN